MALKWLGKKRRPLDNTDDLNKALERLGSSLRVENRKVCGKNRQSHVFLNYIDFWENGIKWLGIQGVACVDDMARLLICWNEKCMCSHEIEDEFPEIKFPEPRKKIEQGEKAYLDWFWEKLVNKKDKRFGPLIDLCASNEQTRQLMSYIQLRDFGLSRSIGKVNGVELKDLPRIRITDDWEYEVRWTGMAVQEYAGQPRQCIGRGTAREAFMILLDHLPDCGPATYQRGFGCCPPPEA